MRPIPLLFLGIKNWRDIRPVDPVQRIDGGDFEAYAAFFGMGDVEAGSMLLANMRRILKMLRQGEVNAAEAYLERFLGE